ncbi:nucleosome assembly protein 1;2-like isoform X1 [Orbicella faveolata]|uniref:nucleosome assembly protein 1;2-like isoform X1 n=1 Tax=Orbicella faveolata TaxID=48498 RepID=UPI0009E432D8|nr:nucleosome assembly protein 1;2-like isoform X1 [Orbicella faveolata]
MASKIWFIAVLLLAVSVGFEAFTIPLEEDLNDDSNEMDYPKDYNDDDDEDDDDDDNVHDGNNLDMEDTNRGRPPRRRRLGGKPKQRGKKPAKRPGKQRRPWG